MLTHPCSFTEFWKGYESEKLIDLMDVKGLRTKRQKIPSLEAFLQPSPKGWRPTVWSLCQFLATKDTLAAPPVVRFDYGFRNCTSEQQNRDLNHVYRRLLATADPMGLHEACYKGGIFEFASRHMALDVRFKALMQSMCDQPDVVET